MRYHFGDERRMRERRMIIDPNYTGVERRWEQRRVHAPEKKSKLTWIVLGLIAAIGGDAAFLDGQYRHQLASYVSADAAATREWSAHVWL